METTYKITSENTQVTKSSHHVTNQFTRVQQELHKKEKKNKQDEEEEEEEEEQEGFWQTAKKKRMEEQQTIKRELLDSLQNRTVKFTYPVSLFLSFLSFFLNFFFMFLSILFD